MHIHNTNAINVGDTVYADFGQYGRTEARAGVVVSKTANGTIKVDFGRKDGNGKTVFTSFMSHGRERGPSSRWYAANLITAERYSELIGHQNAQLAERKAKAAIRQIGEIPFGNRAALIEALEAALAAVKAMEGETK